MDFIGELIVKKHSHVNKYRFKWKYFFLCLRVLSASFLSLLYRTPIENAAFPFPLWCALLGARSVVSNGIQHKVLKILSQSFLQFISY